MQQTLFPREKEVPPATCEYLSKRAVVTSALRLWQKGRHEEALGIIENWICHDASLFYVYAGLKGLCLAERTLAQALGYLRLAVEMLPTDPNLQPALEETRHNLDIFNVAMLEAVTALGLPTTDPVPVGTLGEHRMRMSANC
jgi:hypothetical protein